MQDVKAREIDVAAIHDVDRAGFGDQQIERMNVVQLAVRDVNEARDVAAQIEQRVHLHRGLGRSEKCAHGNTDRHRSMVVESSA